MTNQTLLSALNTLSSQRDAFCSEADFQFALAWELQKLMPQAKISLEYPIQIESKDCHIDIWVEESGFIYPIELKYKTKGGIIGGVTLKNHSAVDFGCYDYLYDIYRIEQIKATTPNFDKGFAVMLTNEPSYYNHTNRSSAYNDFKIFQNSVHNGAHAGGLTNKGTIFNSGNRDNFSLAGSYTMRWNVYNNYDFRFVISEI